MFFYVIPKPLENQYVVAPTTTGVESVARDVPRNPTSFTGQFELESLTLLCWSQKKNRNKVEMHAEMRTVNGRMQIISQWRNRFFGA